MARLVPLLQALAWLVPGGARSLSIPAGLVTTLAAAGLCANAFPAALQRLVTPHAFQLHGLQPIAPPDAGVPATTPAWVFGALGLALAVHVWGVIRDVRAARSRRQAATSDRSQD